MKISILALSLLLMSSIFCAVSTSAVSVEAKTSSRKDDFDPCPSYAGIEPPPCVASTLAQNWKELDCSAPGRYYFSAKNKMGCAGMISKIHINMLHLYQSRAWITKFKLMYTLYTGIGYQKDDGQFHIDAVLRGGDVIRDILKVQLDLQHCHYGAGVDLTIPVSGGYVMPFDFTAHDVESINIRVDPALNVGRGDHC